MDFRVGWGRGFIRGGEVRPIIAIAIAIVIIAVVVPTVGAF